ncbi:hypothetical protein CERSUDRAFT_99495 [Gelatoporia subvermispora B]|uniref:Uncharacterized protein n=1 Tax=Ceriporiopsis subvermispora (strain B) TaxID=914234 RepID=M2R2G3_CERS8|nr:hypothetical protein CERSUDRAFT_99495 [Gelatoporia subvermispora B]
MPVFWGFQGISPDWPDIKYPDTQQYLHAHLKQHSLAFRNNILKPEPDDITGALEPNSADRSHSALWKL